MAIKYPNLFSPIKVGRLEIKNRIAMMPMGVFSPRLMNLKCGAYTKDGADYYIERAKGGAGLIITGLIPVIPLPIFNPVNAPDDFVGGMKYLMDGAHRHGAKIFVQLTAMNGRAAHAESEAELRPTPAPAPIQNVWDPAMENRGMSKDEIRLYVRNFAEVAWLVRQAGGDGVEIHAVHEGYLLDQFAIANFNRRTDKYGGSLENRLRFPSEIVRAIKEKCGAGFPVSMRYSARSYAKGFNRGALPGEAFAEFGRDLDESRIVARMLQDAGYDMLNCDNGSYDSWYWAHPPMYMPKACNLGDVAEIKKAVGIPVACAGRFDEPDVAEAAIAAGRIDMMGMGRPLLADPDLPNKFASGDLDAVRPCICCHQGCLGRIFQGKDISCAVNPACGREKSWAIAPAQTRKRVAVVGGGLGGMEAARVCALRGHEVDLYEKTGELGGVFLAASAPDFKDDDKRLLAWYVRQMKELGVSLHMGRAVTKELLDGIERDELFIATGASERRLNAPGLDGANVAYAVEALRGAKAKIKGKNIVVVGGGLTGCEIAYMLARDGKKVTIVEMSETILNAFGLSAANYNMLMELMDHYKVAVLKNSVLESYADGKAVVAETIKNYPNAANRARRMYALGPKGMVKKREMPADSIVVSIGYTGDRALYDELRGARNTYLVGDAKQPANIMDAIWAAYEIAKDV
ncbi:MAG: FAD-dependent oxidoreductase [Clostridiales bacterium]|jgi:2-enoate reductase|nr:FAD-dependent oxidoreductase [Clostridiales bacterium]